MSAGMPPLPNLPGSDRVDVSTKKNNCVGFLPLLLMFGGLAWLRLVNLGYSDYQGDEIKALFLPVPGQSFTDFLLAQRKGPTQFIVTFLTGLLDPLYLNQFLIRLPFAVASLLATLIYYHFVKLHFGKKIALGSAFFFSFNGIVVALSRIAQYQAFVFFFCTLTLLLLSLAAMRSEWRLAGLYLGMLTWALAVLTHFDGVFIAPFVLYLFWLWYRSFADRNARTKGLHLLLASSLAVLILGGFYLPFFFSITDATKEYWLGRLSGGDHLVSSSLITFQVYNPKGIIYLYAGLLVAYAISTVRVVASSRGEEGRTREGYHVCIRSLAVFLWFLLPWLYMELLVNVPGTHIYTYLIPLAILLAIGMVAVEDFLKTLLGARYGTILAVLGLALAFLFMFYQSHKLFVDHTREYPWEEERFLFWTLSVPDKAYHLPLFGFPYNRQWEQLGEYVTSSENTGHYYSNEKETISRFYVPYDRSAGESGHFLKISNVQDIYQDWLEPKAVWWSEHYLPGKTFSTCDYGDHAWGTDFLYVFAPVVEGCSKSRVVAEVYYMTGGSLEDILANTN